MITAPRDPVLVVDDDRNLLELLERAFEHEGFRCLTARSAEEALALVREARPCAAVLDGLLPGMRGDALARKLRERFAAAELPILFVSSFFRDLRSYRYLTLECGVTEVVHKPIPAPEIVGAISRMLGKGAAEADEPFSADIAQLLPEYLAASRQRVGAMRVALRSLGSAEEPAGRELLRADAHRLRGSGLSFGLPEISRLSGQIEDLVTGMSRPLAPAARAKLSGLLDALEQKLSRAAGERPIAVEPFDPTALRIALVDGPSELGASCRVAAAAGARLQVFSSAAETLHALRDALAAPAELDGALAAGAGRPDIVFVAGDQPDLDGFEECERLLAEGVRPIALIAADDSMEYRLRVVRSGIEAQVPRPPDAEALLNLARDLARRCSGASVLAIDEDPSQLQELAHQLARHRIALQPCQDPDEALPALERTDATLVIVGNNQSRRAPLELLRVIRADPIFAPLPVVMLARDEEELPRLRGLESGADAVLYAPFDGEELAAQVRFLVERASRLRRERLRDPVTGAFLRPYLQEAAERGLALARRAGRELALLVFDFDAEAVCRERGRLVRGQIAASLASQLRSAFRATDLIARVGPGRFAVLLDDVTAETARKLLAERLETFEHRFQSLELPLRGALATFPGTEGGGKALLLAAEAALTSRD